MPASEPGCSDSAHRRRLNARFFLGQGWPYLLAPFIPVAIAARPRRRQRGARLLRLGARHHPHRGADGPRHRGAGLALRSRDRRPSERHLRQRPGADHRPVRARPGPPRARQGDPDRVDHRQHPAGPRRIDAGGRAGEASRQTLQRHQRERPEHDVAGWPPPRSPCPRSSSSRVATGCRPSAPSGSSSARRSSSSPA